MRRRSLAVVVIGVQLFGSSGASADPTNWPQLAQIIAWLEQIDRTLRDINRITEDIKGKLNLVYPLGSLRKIETFFDPVDSIKDEVEKLSCNWRFTPRVERLRLALFKGGSFCRSEWNQLFGGPAPTMDADLESYYDWSAVRRLNLIRTRNEKGPRRASEAAWLAREAILGRDGWDYTKPYSPGYSQRLSALAAAELGNVMVETGDTQTAMLELDQEILNDRRRRRMLDHQAAWVTYVDIARRGEFGVQTTTTQLLGEQ
jgi:hypothetical protein